MKKYVGILLENSSSEHLAYFDTHVEKYIQYYQSYNQMLMQCDIQCSFLLIPLTFSQYEDVLRHAESINVQLYLYYFTNGTCQIYEMKKTGLSSLLKTDQNDILNLCWNKQHIRIYMYDILYIESCRNLIRIYTTYDNLCIHMRLADILPLLDSSYFIRCHQSYIINMKYVYSLKRYESVLMNGIRIPISKAHSKQVREFYKQLFVEL